MVNTSAAKYNVTGLDANSFADLFFAASKYTQNGLGYGIVLTVWLLSMAALAQYPNVDTLKSSTYTAWLTSVLLTVFGVIGPAFPTALFLLVAAMAAHQTYQSR